MIGNILFHDWRIIPPYHYFFYDEFQCYKTLDDMPDISFLDTESQSVIRRFISLALMVNVFEKKRYFYNFHGLEEKLSKQERKKLSVTREEFKQKYKLKLSDGMTLEDCSCCFSHGLKLLPKHMIGYIESKLFIDAGAFIGDSALSFLPFNPGMILSFEPSAPMFDILQKNHDRIKELNEKCEIYQLALGENSEDLHFCDDLFSSCHEDSSSTLTVKQTTLDEFISKYDAPVGLIKADIEGMGLKMIRGAEQTIRRDLPILSIAVYHCPEEMFGIPEILKSWGLKYTFRYKFLEPETTRELTLLAWPEKLN